MRITTILYSSALAFALASPVLAGDTRIVVSGGLLINQGNTVDLTQKTTGGYTLEAGALFDIDGFGPKINTYLGYGHFPAASGTIDRPTFTLSSTRLGADLVYQPWDSLPLTLGVGPSFHIWKGDQNGGDPSLYPSDQHNNLGWRAGIGYDRTTHWSLSLRYTATEWRSNPDLGLDSTNPSRPAYFSLMATYRF